MRSVSGSLPGGPTPLVVATLSAAPALLATAVSSRGVFKGQGVKERAIKGKPVVIHCGISISRGGLLVVAAPSTVAAPSAVLSLPPLLTPLSASTPATMVA